MAASASPVRSDGVPPPKKIVSIATSRAQGTAPIRSISRWSARRYDGMTSSPNGAVLNEQK